MSKPENPSDYKMSDYGTDLLPYVEPEEMGVVELNLSIDVPKLHRSSTAVIDTVRAVLYHLGVAPGKVGLMTGVTPSNPRDTHLRMMGTTERNNCNDAGTHSILKRAFDQALLRMLNREILVKSALYLTDIPETDPMWYDLHKGDEIVFPADHSVIMAASDDGRKACTEYARLLEDERWDEVREVILERDGHACVVCKTAMTPLHIHHILYLRHNGILIMPWLYPLDMLMTVCSRHHDMFHGRM